jgi:ABC-2 type transport system ATP-binding protein
LLAQALVHNPDIIIMDEPAANLDPKARSEFFSSLMKLKKEGKAIFISSHILAEIDKYADSATILDGGKIIFSGGKCELMKFFNTNK